MLAGVYIAVSGAYIVGSTLVVSEVFEETGQLVEVELWKGLSFVLVTGMLLYFGSHYLLSRLKRQLEQIERQRRSIELLDRRAASGLLASAIGHDANNLLTSVTMAVELLKCGPSLERREDILHKLSHAVDELTILNQRLVRGGQADQPGELKVLSLKNESERVMQFLEKDHPVSHLDLTFNGDSQLTAPLNRHLYFQVMLNLLSNAARHAGACAKVCVSISSNDDSICVCVDDNGPGVPPDEREQIFTPYYSNHPDGSGLGLASVRAILRMHGGDVVCEESALGGACFRMNFPQQPVNGYNSSV